jgi:hypothetical protein
MSCLPKDAREITGLVKGPDGVTRDRFLGGVTSRDFLFFSAKDKKCSRLSIAKALQAAAEMDGKTLPEFLDGLRAQITKSGPFGPDHQESTHASVSGRRRGAA